MHLLLGVHIVLFQKRDSPKRRKYNNIGLIISTTYLILTLALKAYTYQHFRHALLQQRIAYTDIQTRPTPFNTILWTANVETKDSYLIAEYSLFDTQEIRFRSFPKQHHLLDNLKDEDKVKRLIKIAEGWYTAVEKDGQLYFNDLRFGLMTMDPNEEQFVFSYSLTYQNQELQVHETSKFDTDRHRLLRQLWHRIWGN